MVLVEIVVLLGLVELGVRMAVSPQTDVPHLRVHASGSFTWYPGSRFTYHNLPKVEPATAEVRINGEGLRGEEFPRAKQLDERRILVLGDSYTAAVQLPETAIFTSLLEVSLNAAGPAGGTRYRVLNAGFNGAGTATELIYFLRRGVTLAPDVVVLQVTPNDVDDTLAHGGFRWRGDEIVLDPSLENPPFWREALLAARDVVGNRSLAFYLLYKMARSLLAGDAAAADPGVTLVVGLIDRLLSAANQSGIPVVILTLPQPLDISGANPRYEQLKVVLRPLVEGSRNQLLVMDAPLAAAHAQGEPVYLAHDGHLGTAGHRLVAEALRTALARYGIPGRFEAGIQALPEHGRSATPPH